MPGDDCFGVLVGLTLNTRQNMTATSYPQKFSDITSLCRGGGAMVARLTPDQKVASSILADNLIDIDSLIETDSIVETEPRVSLQVLIH